LSFIEQGERDMRTINIERAVLVAGEHIEPGPAEFETEMADYLVRQGCASEIGDEIDDEGPAPVKALADLTVAELTEIAAAEGVTLGDKPKKAEIVEAIEKARAAAGNGA
jgi:hypothetical protein